MLRTLLFAFLALSAASVSCADVDFGSAHAIVVDDATGDVLFSKDAQTAAPIASLTKLLTAMVVLDARQAPDDRLRITDADIDRLKRTRSGVPVGTAVARATLLELALVASDNRAASALARHYRGGSGAFGAAMRRKIRALDLGHTSIEEPTGLSPNNVSSAEDMAKVLRAAARYPEITRITSQPSVQATVRGRPWLVRNTNPLVGAPGWNVLLSKTGYTLEAGRCLSMRMQAGGRTVTLVLMGAALAAERALDALNVLNWLSGATSTAQAQPQPQPGGDAGVHVQQVAGAPVDTAQPQAADSSDTAEGSDAAPDAPPAPDIE
jgi:serine-type D-Ala-D-Ala endopeptidase (penicillin-binding protein 7)